MGAPGGASPICLRAYILTLQVTPPAPTQPPRDISSASRHTPLRLTAIGSRRVCNGHTLLPDPTSARRCSWGRCPALRQGCAVRPSVREWKEVQAKALKRSPATRLFQSANPDWDRALPRSMVERGMQHYRSARYATMPGG